MVNFRVGDRVEVISSGSSSLEDGDIGTITIVEGTSAKVRVNNKSAWGNWVAFKDLKLVPSDSQRIEMLEKDVAEMRVAIEKFFEVPMEVE